MVRVQATSPRNSSHPISHRLQDILIAFRHSQGNTSFIHGIPKETGKTEIPKHPVAQLSPSSPLKKFKMIYVDRHHDKANPPMSRVDVSRRHQLSRTSFVASSLPSASARVSVLCHRRRRRRRRLSFKSRRRLTTWRRRAERRSNQSWSCPIFDGVFTGFEVAFVWMSL